MIYAPDDELVISGDASDMDIICQSLSITTEGSVVLADGTVSHIITQEKLSDDQISSLESKFGCSWSASRT